MTDIKKVPAIKTIIEPNFEALTLEFANGQRLCIDVCDLSTTISQQALVHGLKQKLVDAAAISRNAITGQSATVYDKYEAVRAVYDRLLAGDWNAPREGGGLTGGLLLKALVRMYDGRKTVEQLTEFLAGKTDPEKAALKKNAKIAAIIVEIQSERAKDSGIDTDELLDELDEG
jgi:hypothetical protein